MNEDECFRSYDQWMEDLPNRYLPPQIVGKLIPEKTYAFEIIGKSFENRPIYKLSVGKGPIKLLFVGQVHGNESTATRAMFDIWKLIHLEENRFENLLEKTEISFIPQLNPDGAYNFTRRNAANIDINRDFIAEQTPEMKAFKENIEHESYDYIFTLHDQRTIFHPKDSQKPATLSFLAPVTGPNTHEIPLQRLKAIQLISCMVQTLESHIPGQMARFSDEYYPKAIGDNLQKMGYPTILIECGHFPGDYNRNQTRKFTSFAILGALDAIMNQKHLENNASVYQNLPENSQKNLDIIYRQVKIQNDQNFSIVDLGIQYEEVLENPQEISFRAKIVEIGDLSDYYGYDIYHAENRVFRNISDSTPKIGQIAEFNLSEWNILNGKPIHGFED